MNLFTVEQLELVRRLRLSGMSAEAIVEAYRSLDQIENELKHSQQQSKANDSNAETLNSIGSPAVSAISHQTQSQTSPPAALAANQLSSPIIRHLNSQALQQFTQRDNQHCAITVPESCLFGAPLLSAGLPAPATQQNQSSPECQSTPSSASSTTTSTMTQPPIFTADHFRFPTANGFCAPSMINRQQSLVHAQRAAPIPSPLMCRPLRPSQQHPRGHQRNDLPPLDNPSEVEEFMQQGEEYCINEMKKFITQYSLRQTTVAQMTGVSQPYISKLLNGNHRELSLRCRRNIYSWYLNCRRHPAIYCQDPTTRLETNGDGELVPQRRERYVFRPILIRILEAYFAESPFPDTQKRAEISQTCNNALQAEKKGTHLMPKEVVTPQVIANWFANKRKEMRRKSNEENRPRNLLTGVHNMSDFASTPSPSGSSSTANAESPITTMLPGGLLAPLQLPGQNPLSILIQQGQQPISMENFLEARQPILQLGAGTIPTSLSELLFNNNNNSIAAPLPLRGFLSNQFNTNNKTPTAESTHEANNNEAIEQTTTEAQNSQHNMPPLLCSIKDDVSIEESEEQQDHPSSPKSFKIMSDNDVMMESHSTTDSNQQVYAELFQKMLDSGMLNMIQQQLNNA